MISEDILFSFMGEIIQSSYVDKNDPIETKEQMKIQKRVRGEIAEAIALIR